MMGGPIVAVVMRTCSGNNFVEACDMDLDTQGRRIVESRYWLDILTSGCTNYQLSNMPPDWVGCVTRSTSQWGLINPQHEGSLQIRNQANHIRGHVTYFQNVNIRGTVRVCKAFCVWRTTEKPSMHDIFIFRILGPGLGLGLGISTFTALWPLH